MEKLLEEFQYSSMRIRDLLFNLKVSRNKSEYVSYKCICAWCVLQQYKYII